MAALSPSLPQPSPSPLAPPPGPETSNSSTGDLWYVGAIINVVGSISINLGMNLIKLGHTKRAQLDVPEEEKPPIRKFKVWVIGLIIFITGNILNFVSFAFAAQSLLAALGSLQLVCNVVFAYLVNKEPVTKLIILSTTCIIGGCVLLVVFGNQSSETYTVEELIKLYTFPAYVVYLVMMGVFVFGFYVMYLHAKKVCRTRGERGIWYGMMLVSYAIFSALLGSQSVLFGKSISVILRTTFTESNQLGNWYTWVVLPLFTFTALFWVARLNKGLRMFPAMIIVPLLQIAWTLFSIVSGMLYFQEYKGFTTLKAIMFPVGVTVVFLGVFLLTVCGGGKRPPGDQSEEGAEDKTSVYDNATYNSDAGDGAHPLETPSTAHPHSAVAAQQSKISLGQTLRFTSTWAPPSVAVSPGAASTLNRTLVPTTDSLRRQRRTTQGTIAASDLNTTDLTDDLTPPGSAVGAEGHYGGPGGGWGNRTYDKNSTLNRTAQSNASQTSMMSTMRKGLKSVGSRLTSDMGLDVKDGFKLAVGLGDSHLAGVSLFAMPALDFTATAKAKHDQYRQASRNGAHGGGGGGRGGGSQASSSQRASEVSILSALPKSRFYKGDADGLAVIREASGAVPSASPDLNGSLTTSSQLPASSLDSHVAVVAALGAAPGGGRGGSASTGSPELGRATPGGAGGRQHHHHAYQDLQQQQPLSSGPSAGGSPPLPARGAAGSDRPLTEAAMLNLLPGPSFSSIPPHDSAAAPRPAADGGGQPQQQQPLPSAGPSTSSPPSPMQAPSRHGAATGSGGSPPGAAPGAGAGAGAGGAAGGAEGRAQRSRRPSALPEGGSWPLPGFGHPPGPGPGPGPPTSYAFYGGGGGGYDSDAYSRSSPTGRGGGATGPPQYLRPPTGMVGGGAALGGAGAISASFDAGGVPGGGGGGGGGAAGRTAARAGLPKPGSLGALLPEGVPLSTANSVVFHESSPDTPAELAMQPQLERLPGYGGGGGGGGVSGTRPQSPWGHQRQQTQLLAQQLPPAPPSVQLLQQQQLIQQQQLQLQLQQQQQQLLQQQQQLQQGYIPLSLLQRAQVPPMAAARLPARHLLVPGMPVSPSQLLPPPSAVAATGAPAGQYGYGQYGSTASMSYTQLLTSQGQVFADSVAMRQQQLGGGSLSLGGAAVSTMAGGPGFPAGTVRVQGSMGGGVGAGGARSSYTPHAGGLSVSRSWAGMPGLSAGGAVGPAGGGGAAAAAAGGGARQSPLRGTLLGQMQRPLRPWQQY